MINKKYILAIIAVLLCLIFCLTGCKKTYQAGDFSYHWLSTPLPSMGIKSDTNKFPKDNVTFDLYLGLHDLNSGTLPKQQYDLPDERVIFVIYACEKNTHHLYKVNDVVSDYTKLDKLYYIKHIDEEQAFTEEYGFIANSEDGVVYNHREPITVPQKVFDSQNNSFSIIIVTYVQDESTGGYMIVDRYNGIKLGYKFLSKHEVKIDFSSEDYGY